MTSPPSDLVNFRTEVRRLTGLAADAVGIVGDGAHQRTGGYHEGVDVLVSIGRYHPPATSHVGSTAEDYSARQLRDRQGLTGSASAVDIGAAWAQGRAAWLRYNNLLYTEMRDRPERLPALRAINVSLDGRTKQRYDQLHRVDGLTPSTDTVDSHTHHEYWRDTEGTPVRAQTLARQLQLIAAAITGGNMSGEADAAFVKPYTGTEPWVSGQSWMAKAVEAPLRTTVDLLRAIAGRVDIDATELAAIEAAARAGAAAAFDPAAIVERLAPVLAEHLGVDQAAVVAALESEAGQAALVRAGNAAEDS